VAVSADRRAELASLSQEAIANDAASQGQVNAERRRPLFKDVEALVSPGFLSAKIQVGETTVALRSMFPGDLFILDHRVRKGASDKEWKSWVLATATWMLDGQLLLQDRQAVSRLFKTYQHLPGPALEILWSVMTGLFSRVAASLPKIEAYCYENHSRALWKFCGQQTPARDDFAGIPGVGSLGMNLVQRIWVSYNLNEDERIQEMALWNVGKLIASAASPKGIKKLNASDEKRMRQEETRRKRVLDKMYYDEVGWKEVHSQLVFQPHSADELVEQMRRWKDGEKDLHDIIVDAWKERVRHVETDRREEISRLAEEQRKRDAEAREQQGGRNPVVGYTLEQAQQLMGDRVRKGRRVVHEKPGNSVKFDRYLSSDPELGYMGDGGARPLGGREEETPPPSLTEKVTGRNPAFVHPEDMVPAHLRERFQNDISEGGRCSAYPPRW
jgi:hypothetical protein